MHSDDSSSHTLRGALKWSATETTREGDKDAIGTGSTLML